MYKGRSFRRVIEMSGPQEIEQAVSELGIEATLPDLIHALKDNDSFIKKIELKVWPALPRSFKSKHLEWMPMPADSTRSKVHSALIYIGPQAEATIPILIRQARKMPFPQNGSILAAISEAGRNSPAAFEYLMEAARDPDERVRSLAALDLSYFTSCADAIVPLLTSNMLAATSAPLNEMHALSMLGTNAAPAAPVVIRFLNENGKPGNWLTALRHAGPGASVAVPALTRLAASNNPLAIEALMNIGPGAREALPVLSNIVANNVGLTRSLAVAAIARVTENPSSAIPDLIDGLQGRWGKRGSEPNWSSPWNDSRLMSIGLNRRETAAWLLGEFGPAGHDAVPALSDALEERNAGWLSLFAARALWLIESNSTLVLPRLMRTLETKNTQEIQIAVRILGEIGPQAAPAEPILRTLRTNEWSRTGSAWVIRREINNALRRIHNSQERAPK